MVRLPESHVLERLADVLTQVADAGDRVVLHRHGKDVAALVSMEDLARLEAFEDAADVAAARAAIDEPGASVAWEQLRDGLPR